MIEVNFKGICQPNPGKLFQCGARMSLDGKVFHEISERIVLAEDYSGTNNGAEFYIIGFCLEYLLERYLQDECIVFYGDMNFIITLMNNPGRIARGKYYKYAVHAVELAKQFKSLTFQQIPRKKNVIAYSLSKVA